VIGAGSWGTSVALMLARAGVQVDLGCRTAEQAERVAASRRNERYLPGAELPPAIDVMRAGDLELSRHDVVVFAVPAAALPAAIAAHAPNIPARTGRPADVQGPRPAAGHAAQRLRRRADELVGGRASWAGPAHPHTARRGDGVSLVVASADAAFRRQVGDALTR
jgi:glycerol-3-phosphate dehydrogenase